MKLRHSIIYGLLILVYATPLFAQTINLPPNKAEIVPTTDYVIYIPWGTLPTLYAAIHMQLHNKPSFLWFLREDTINPALLPSNVQLVGTPGNREDVALIGDIVKELITTNPEASFTLFTDDMQSGRIFLQLLLANGVKPTKAYIRILSDGSGTYNFYKDLFAVNNGGLATYQNSAKYFYTLYYRTIVNQNSDAIPQDNLMWADLANQMFALASFPVAELWISYPDLLLSDDYLMGLGRMQIHARDISPQFLLNSLTKTQKERFLKLLNFNKTYFDDLLKINPNKIKPPSVTKPAETSNDETAVASISDQTEEKPAAVEKHKLIVTMTDPISASFTPILSQIIADYIEDFDIFLKPHPNALPSESQIEQYKVMGVTEVLPGRLPMEILLWIYPNINLGGYQSSLYMTASKEQTLFFISNGPEDLPEPQHTLYLQGGFPLVKFYNRY